MKNNSTKNATQHAIPSCSSGLTSGHTSGQPTRLIPVPNWNKHYEWPPLGGLRGLIFNSRKNGFDKVIKRIGRRVLIDEAAFFAWVNEKNDVGSTSK